MPWATFCDAAASCLAGRVNEGPDDIGASAYGPSLELFQRKVSEIESTRRAFKALAPSALLPLLRKFRSRAASDQRDKVFALLGLVNFWGQDEPITPNYKLRLSEVYLETTKKLIRSSGSLAVLSGTTASRSQTAQGFPSWITDWSYDAPYHEHVRLGMHHMYKAAGDTVHGIQLHGRTLLQTKGYHIDTIQSVFLMDNPKNDKEKLRGGVVRWREAIPWGDHTTYRSGGTIQEAFWRTVCGNAICVPAAETDLGRFRKATARDASTFRAWALPPTIDVLKHRRTSIIAGTVQGAEEPTTPEEQEKQKQRNAVHLSIDYASRGRCLIITSQGYIGTSSTMAHQGDEIFVLQGSRVPFVLRRAKGSRVCRDKLTEKLVLSTEKSEIKPGSSATAADISEQEAARFGVCNEDHDTCYRVIGDAYVHGAMESQMTWENGQVGCKRREPVSIYLV